jgi:two-component system chemotaxis response regulator CheY
MNPKKTVMVVDDSVSVRQAICGSLEEAGYDTVEAEDGTQAIAQLDGRKINLIICDVNMPNMDGITFVKEMRTMESYKFTPVIMLTTESAEAKRLQGQMAGAKAWVVKPFRPQQMMNAIAKLIQP